MLSCWTSSSPVEGTTVDKQVRGLAANDGIVHSIPVIRNLYTHKHSMCGPRSLYTQWCPARLLCIRFIARIAFCAVRRLLNLPLCAPRHRWNNGVEFLPARPALPSRFPSLLLDFHWVPQQRFHICRSDRRHPIWPHHPSKQSTRRGIYKARATSLRHHQVTIVLPVNDRRQGVHVIRMPARLTP